MTRYLLLLSLTAVLAESCASSEEAAGWIADGVIGQSAGEGNEPFESFACRVVGDREGGVYLDGKRYLAPGSFTPVPVRGEMPGCLYSDGEELFAVDTGKGTVQRVRSCRGAIKCLGERFPTHSPNWGIGRFTVAPACCAKGFCRTVKFAVLDTEERKVFAFDREGRPLGVILDFAAHPKAKLFCSVGFLSDTGDLLIGTAWPEEMTRRFLPDGTEANDGWPMRAEAAAYGYADGKTWAFAKQAIALTAAPGMKKEKFGASTHTFNSIAKSGCGVWLGSSCGAMFFERARPGDCVKRLGGLGRVEALALIDGRVIVFGGTSVRMFYLDALADEPAESTTLGWLWTFNGDSGGRVHCADVRDGLVYFDFEKDGRRSVWSFNYRKSLWMQRKERFVKLESGSVKPFALPDGFPAGDWTAFAQEGNWAVAYSPSRKAVVRFRRVSR